MIREERSVFLAVLTLVVYSAFMLIEKGTLLFPYPLNEIILLFVVLQFAYWNGKKHVLLGILSVSTAVLNLLSQQFIWTFFLDPEAMERLTHGSLLDILRILYYLTLLTWSLTTLTETVKGRRIALISTSIIGFSASIAFPYPIVELIPLFGMMIYAIIRKPQSPMHLLWILMAVLQTMKVSMIHLL
jgi:hypothetical protein